MQSNEISITPEDRAAEGRGHSTKFYMWSGLRPEVQTLTLLYTIFDTRGPFVYLSWKIIPLPYALLHEIFATLKFREFEAAIFRDTLISRFCGNLKSPGPLKFRDYIQNIAIEYECSYRMLACTPVYVAIKR